MTSDEKWAYLANLEDELLLGAVMLSEWTAYLVRDADTAFCAGANLSAILSAQAAIDAHLRYEYFSDTSSRSQSFAELIQKAPLDSELASKLETIRRFRNKWTHVADPEDDQDLVDRPEYHEEELERIALLAIETLHRIVYLEQWT